MNKYNEFRRSDGRIVPRDRKIERETITVALGFRGSVYAAELRLDQLLDHPDVLPGILKRRIHALYEGAMDGPIEKPQTDQ